MHADSGIGRSVKNVGGYTLIEMAIIMVVLGIFIGVGYPLYHHYVDKGRFDQTLVAQVKIDRALETFKQMRGRYPCPARYDVAPSHPDYGRETLCTTSAVAPGNCADGLCYEESTRTIMVRSTASDGTESTQPVRPRVIRGALPFKALGIMEDDSYDAYNARFSYAVTQLLTDKQTFRPERGGIDIVDGNEPTPNSLINPSASALYYVFSHGPDNIGAYNKEGFLMGDCDGPMHDNQNCNTDSTHASAVYRHALRSTVPIQDYNASKGLPGGGGIGSTENTHFDDFVSFAGIGMPPIWESGENTLRERTDSINLTSSVQPKVVIGQDIRMANDEDLRLEVLGDVTVTPNTPSVGNVRLDEMCDRDNADCFSPILLAGPNNPDNPTHLRCADNRQGLAPKGIDHRVIRCIPADVDCPGGFLRGIDANRRPVCGTVSRVRCGSEAHSLCNTVQYLPANTTVGTTHVLRAGASRATTFTCSADPNDANEGIWVEGASTGVCTCTPGVIRTTRTCGRDMDGGITEEVRTVCPSGDIDTTVISNTCRCVPSTTTSTQNCPANFSGTRTSTRTVTCNGNRPVVRVTETANTCTCVANVQNRTQTCPAGFTGRINQSRAVQCPAGTWSGWTNVSNSCVCRPSYTQQRACPTGMNIGTITETCRYTCDTANLTATGPTCTQTSNTCDCRPSTVITQETCGEGFTGQVRVTTVTTCPPNAGTTVTRNRDNCTPQTRQCTYKRSGGALPGTFTRVPNGQYEEGDSCSYTGDSRPCKLIRYCYVGNGTGNYSRYSCECQDNN